MANADFTFAWEKAQGLGSPWSHLEVARVRGREGISDLYRYELTVIARAPAPEVDPRDLIGMRATLRIETTSEPARKVVHGIVAEAEELFDHPDGMVHRVILVPPWARAMHRQKCRIFLDKTLREIIDAVLKGDPLMKLRGGAQVENDDGAPVYQPAAELYTWRVRDTSRLDDRRVRSYVVQYNESDFHFVARLLEEEGISYHFENGNETCLLVLSDSDEGKWRLAPSDLLSASIISREVKHLSLGARLRPKSVVLDDYNWKKPKLQMTASGERGASANLEEYHYPGGYPDAPAQGKPLAAARIDRYQVEASYAVGEGAVRLLSAGSVFKLEHKDTDHEGEYLVTNLTVRGEQQGILKMQSAEQDVPWSARFELARRGAGTSVSESRFRPRLSTRKPRVLGVQTAVVTADPSAKGAEVNVGGPDGISIGCVKVRFRWDTEEARLSKEPSSMWVRVSQIFAGAGEGGVFHPRVGDEVLVDHDEGDPDRPVVVGRVYNGANLPSHNAAPESAMKSLSTPGGGTYNEIMYGDPAGRELLHYFAGKDQTTDVANFRRESVVVNATMTVGGNNSETIGANRTETVGANDSLTVGANQSITIGANSTTLIGGNFTHVVGANEANTVGGTQTISVGGNLTEIVGGAVTETYGASRTSTVGGAVSETFGATMSVTVGANVDEKCASHKVTVSSSRLMLIGGNYLTAVGGSSTADLGAVSLEVSGGSQALTVSGTIHRSGPIQITTAALEHDIRAAHVDAQAKSSAKSAVFVKLLGLNREVFGIKVSKSKTKRKPRGIDKTIAGVTIKAWGIGMVASGVDNQGGGPNTEV